MWRIFPPINDSPLTCNICHDLFTLDNMWHCNKGGIIGLHHNLLNKEWAYIFRVVAHPSCSDQKNQYSWGFDKRVRASYYREKCLEAFQKGGGVLICRKARLALISLGIRVCLDYVPLVRCVYFMLILLTRTQHLKRGDTPPSSSFIMISAKRGEILRLASRENIPSCWFCYKWKRGDGGGDKSGNYATNSLPVI